MQTKSALRFLPTLVTEATRINKQIIKKTITSAGWMWRKCNTCSLLVGMQTGEATWESQWRVLRNARLLLLTGLKPMTV